MHLTDLPNHITAYGIDGLNTALFNILQNVNADLAEHYILYQLGNQKSLIKLNISAQPFQIWYYDLMGRPVTRNIKETIAQFLWQHSDARVNRPNDYEAWLTQEFAKLFNDVSGSERHKEQQVFLQGGDWQHLKNRSNIQQAHQKLQSLPRVEFDNIAVASIPEKNSRSSMFGLFAGRKRLELANDQKKAQERMADKKRR